VGKSHLGSAIGLSLVEHGYRVLFSRTTDLVQKLQQARRNLVLESVNVSNAATKDSHPD
jgi:DNA replication protein DnaC